jgi:hypothetical protein
MGSLAGRKARREPAGVAKPDVCIISDGEMGELTMVFFISWRTIKQHRLDYIPQHKQLGEDTAINRFKQVVDTVVRWYERGIVSGMKT